MKRIILYTIKNEKEIKKLTKNGFLEGNALHIKNNWNSDFLDAYKYIQNQLFISHYPIWLWTQKPNFNHYLFKQWTGIKSLYLLKVEVFDWEPIFSDLYLWDMVIHKIYVPKNSLDEKKWYQYTEKKYKKDFVSFDDYDPKDQKIIISSFQRIFTQFRSEKYSTQACISRLYIENVKSIKKITF